eukprot:TRINITY_DN1457_c0_g1_i1.p1 TRINITY_DN1457_c0_g1~~TRINITY_DN1457_c0_g1_i1.p1  ORF type:complete len:448 (+),score=176.57 TRINITY_DN1457_c0_g1_i1:90-1433(+)
MADSKQESKIEWPQNLQYLAGFGCAHGSEALPGALPKTQNTPQRCPYGLIAEQLSGTAFTVPRARNQRSWLYRIRPSAGHSRFEKIDNGRIRGHFENAHIEPNQLRWNPFPMPAEDQKVDFVQGMLTVGGAGSVDLKNGIAIHVYCCNTSMGNKSFLNADGDFLIVPQEGDMLIRTEYGYLEVKSGEICVIQRGIKFNVTVAGPTRGYICEIFKGHFVLPELGVIGANGLADPRHFLHPTASYENLEGDFVLVQKYGGQLFQCQLGHSPFDVVAWHGNYLPYKYDLSLYCVVNSVLFDHLDPCIFCVLTAATDEPGVAVCDFVIFPPRWAVQEHTFRPPYYHRNVMSEFMGNIRGTYDAKTKGFLPGGASLHQIHVPHGPEALTYKNASNWELAPVRMPDDSLAFMFESTYFIRVTDEAINSEVLDHTYTECWDNIEVRFDPNNINA